MPKSGQARVLTQKQKNRLFDVIAQNRHPEKNTAIMQVSFKLALRAQEIALLQIKEVAKLSVNGKRFTINEVLSLPKGYTKGANATKRSKSKYDRRTISMTVAEFEQKIKQIEKLARTGTPIDPKDYYPELREHEGTARDLPLVDPGLRAALEEYLSLRIDQAVSGLKSSDPLFVTQKGGPYSPNTLQEHMALMLRQWAGVEKASSHSGRRTVATDIIHRQNKSLKVAQKILGHKNGSTTMIYEDPPEEIIGEVLKNLED